MSMMQPYQNFQQNLPQFQNMNYSQQGIQYPYMDRMNYLQSVQQNLQQPNQMLTLGKVVESIDIVKATDIPMDGNMYYFPKADGKEVYAKQWLQNGTTNIITFKPMDEIGSDVVEKQNEMEEFKISLNDIKSDLKSLNEKIEKITKTNTTKSKKENLDE